jgi:DNA-binding MarR family transcriptional regulator
MQPRTQRQREILDYIQRFIERHGYEPSYAQIARHFGVSSKATIAKHIEALERIGYLRRDDDPADARRKIVRLTERGVDSLVRSARIFDGLRAGWAATLGDERLRGLEDALREVAPVKTLRVDVPGWLGS